jgi:hypothetical protein
MKSHSSIFSFDTLHLRGGGRISGAFFFALGLLLAAEVGLRLMVPENHHPTGSWYNEELRDQVQQLEELDKVDIMILGSSVAAVNFPPLVMDLEFERNGHDWTSFNAGVRGCRYNCIELAFRKIFWSRKQPRTVLLVVAPIDVNEANESGLARSERFIESFRIGSLQAFASDLFRHVWVVGWKSEVFQFLKRGRWLHEPSLVEVRGHVNMPDKPDYKARKRIFHIDPDRGELSRSLTDLVEFLVVNGVKVGLVKGIMTSDAYADLGEAQEAEFDRLLTQLSLQPEVELIDATSLAPPNAHFLDQLHLKYPHAKTYGRDIARALLNHPQLRPDRPVTER